MQPVTRVSITQQVVDNIKEFIFSGKVKEGDKLPVERELCENLSVGRSTVREAIRILEATGYVEVKPGRGAFVARTKEIQLEDINHWFDENEVEIIDFLEVRMAIEPLAIKLAIERCSDEDISRLNKIHSNFLLAIKEDNVPKIAIYDEEFHKEILVNSKNKLLISIGKQLELHLKSFRSKTFYIKDNANNAVEPHSEIMEAFMNRDIKKGEKSMISHLKNVEVDLLKSKSN